MAIAVIAEMTSTRETHHLRKRHDDLLVVHDHFDAKGWSPERGSAQRVEVPGIEPGSFGTGTELLRAQPAALFLAPTITQASRRQAQSLLIVPHHRATRQ